MNPGNFFNPYMASRYIPYQKTATNLFSKGLFKGATWNGFLTSAGKTLNVINQAIPIFYQVRPIINNAKTMFRVLGAVKSTDTTPQVRQDRTNQTIQQNTLQEQTTTRLSQPSTQEQSNNPVFFL